MHIRDILSGPQPSLSFEFFPPRGPAAWEDLYQTIRELEALKPTFVSVTYGAGGTTREMTHDLVVRIKQTTTIPPVPHLTCVGHTRGRGHGDPRALRRRRSLQHPRPARRSAARPTGL